MTLNGQNVYAITGNNKVIARGQRPRSAHVSSTLTCLFRPPHQFTAARLNYVCVVNLSLRWVRCILVKKNEICGLCVTVAIEQQASVLSVFYESNNSTQTNAASLTITRFSYMYSTKCRKRCNLKEC